MRFLDNIGLTTLDSQIKPILSIKKDLSDAINKFKESDLATTIDSRTLYLLEIDYEKDLAFNINYIVGDNAPYVGSAIVGQTYVA